MDKQISILHLEDNIADFELINEILVGSGFEIKPIRVETREAFRQNLLAKKFDLIISDYSLPSFNGKEALVLAKEVQPETPFIFISGTIGEEFAVESLRKGAADYIIKNNLRKLAPSVERALDEAEERKKRAHAERELREREQFIQKIANTTPSIIYVYDLREDILLWVNESIKTVLGYSVDEIKNKQHIAEELMHPDDHEKFKSIKTWYIPAHGGEIIDFTYRVKNAAGEWRWFHSRKTIFTTDEEHIPIQILGVAEDITERKELEAQFFRAQRLESIGELAGGIAHDLNNIFGPMLLAIPLLQRKIADDHGKKILHMIENSIHRGTGMVKQILAFARGTQTEKTVLSASQIVQEIENIVKETFPKSLDLQTTIERNTDTVFADHTQLHQVLLNLTVNARDAMPSGGKLKMTVGNTFVGSIPPKYKHDVKPGPFVLITVEDNGTGISPETLKKIFDPFFTTKEVGKGTGLGLSTVMTIVQNHHGFIDVESVLGQGTTFKVYLPSASAPTETITPEKPLLPLGRGETILIVDNKSSLVTAAKEMLESSNYRAMTALSGAEAIAMFAKYGATIDLVICDLNMPMMDGEKTIPVLRKLKPSIKIIATNGSSRQNNPDEVAKKLGVVVLQKPYTINELINGVHSSLAADQ